MTNHLEPNHICEVCQPLRPVNSAITGPEIGRRSFFQLAGTGVAGYFLLPTLSSEVVAAPPADAYMSGRARNCILVFLNGAPSHTDTFDLKVGAWTPADFNPTSYNGTMFPQGLMPKLAAQLDKLAIVRSLRAPALVHSLQQRWVQVARNPTSQLGKIAPHIGSVASLEFEAQRKPHHRLPVFMSINGGTAGPGYFNGRHAAFNVAAAPTGFSTLVNSDGQAKLDARFAMLKALDGGLRKNSPISNDVTTMGDFYDSSRALMYNPAVDAVFKFSTADQQRYGSTGFGNSCIVARNALKADLGTRFVQLTLGGWDLHAGIYTANGGIYTPARQLDNGLGNLLTDLAATPGLNGGTLLDETLIVAVGEFGRTVGAPNNQAGRDHYFNQFAVFAGGGMAGGSVIGSTNATGSAVSSVGWSQGRNVANEDIAATIYSALGINYLTKRTDDPFGRGFEYVPFASEGAWYPVTELFNRGARTNRSAPTSRQNSDRLTQ